MHGFRESAHVEAHFFDDLISNAEMQGFDIHDQLTKCLSGCNDLLVI